MFVSVAEVPEHCGSRGADAVGMGGMDAEGRASPCDEGGHCEPFVFQLFPECEDFSECGLAAFGAHVKVGIMDVSVVRMESEGTDCGGGGELTVQ